MFEFNTVEEAVKDLKEGKIIIVTDDDDRENEGDFIFNLRSTVRYNRKCQLYGNLWKRSYMYAYE